ncbi:glycosyltransferase [Arhodomonas sp. AD133]|uniref:glycosyltransferase n=1 Tax=Arhodomonas sp. AD133 TaxID=3415009 RepID=UPI003EBC1F93
MTPAPNQPWSPTVDIIVPVYRGHDETRRCIEGVLASDSRTSWRLIVVDDACPEPALAKWLDELATSGDIELIRNERNQGFVRSVNRAMSCHPDRDVVLLNSDTEVHGDWLDRLRACAWADSETGTVTPLTNNGTLASYPRFMADNPLPEGWNTASLDALCANVNAGESVTAPTAVGFCMYIRRDCLAETGYFDARHFGRGYGEENDFSRRATKLGWVHRLCGSVFVAHRGGVSFGDEAQQWRARGSKALQTLHPDYDDVIRAHIEADPQRVLRRRLDMARLRRSSRPRVLNLTHDQGGGVARHLEDMATLLSDELELLELAPDGESRVRLRWLRRGEDEFALWFRLPYEHDELVSTLRGLDIARAHVHHVMNLPRRTLDLAEILDVPLDFTCHDHYPICPQANLADELGEYCGEPDEEGCARCLALRPGPWGLDIRAWREQFHQWLRRADRVFVPSRDIKRRLAGYLPDIELTLLPHPEPARDLSRPVHVAPATPPRGDGEEVRALVLGVMNPAKGAYLLGRCAWDARHRKLPLAFHVIGWFETPLAGMDQLPISVTGAYERDALPALIDQAQADVILLPSRAPESWSYTLSEALATGLPLVAPNRGAFPERLEGVERAVIVDPDSSPTQWNDALIAATRGTQTNRSTCG